ncbi:MAG TPA: hypothetical protein VK506_05575 [Conexibacter sp.]|nr:hypothetical protein [Conexibacter sp.]
MSAQGDRPPAWLVTLQVAAVVALLPLVLLVPVLAGALAAAIVLLGWAPVVGDLLRAARPLAFPLVLVAVVGAFGSALSVGTRIAIGVGAMVVVIPWAARDWVRSGRREIAGSTRQVLRDSGRSIAVALAIAALVLIVLAAVPATRRWIGGSVRSFDDLGGPPIALALCAVAIWAVANVLRAVGFMRSRIRIVLGIALLLLGARLLIEAGLLPAVGIPDVQVLLALAGALLGVVVIVELVAVAQRGSREGRLVAVVRWLGADPLGARAERFLARGLGVAIASTVLLLAAMAWGAIEVTRGDHAIAAGHVRGGEQPATPLADMTDRELAETFVPVLQFAHEERWLPERVDPYVASARLVPRPPAGTALDGGLPTTCEQDVADPCYRLVCPTAASSCAHTLDLSQRSGRTRDGTAYVRVVRRAPAPAATAPGAFAEHRPRLFDGGIPRYRSDLRTLVQYWLFYPYDEWVAPLLAGRLVQRHAADWEAVTVGLSDTRPLFVAYSQHCAGRWRPWEDVLVADVPSPRTHPLVGVAVGSHANYEQALDARSPNTTLCQGLPETSIDLLSYVWNIRDRTADDFSLMPADLVPIASDRAPMTFPGMWGRDDVTEFVGFEPRTIHTGRGPRTPTRQPLWTDPVRRIFCTEAWRGPPTAPCSAPRP